MTFFPLYCCFSCDLLHVICYCRYIAAVDGEVNKRHLAALSEGTLVDGVHCTPDSVELLPRQLDMSHPRLRLRIVVPHCF